MLNTNFKKIDIIKEISKKTGFSVNFSKKILNDLIDIIITELRHGDINIKNKDKIKIIFKNQRVGRNPITKKKHIISSRNTISFTTSKKIIDHLNKFT